MKLNLSNLSSKFTHLIRAAQIFVGLYFTVILATFTTNDLAFSAENGADIIFDRSNPEAEPTAFAPSYIGLILNQNQPWSYGTSTWSKGGPSWGVEYRFFYKDTWSLSISGSFKQLQDINYKDQNLFALSQETLKLLRLYHPWYLAAGGRFSSYVPVRKISIPYERDQSRTIDTGAAISVATIWITNPNVTTMISANRWRSLSTPQRQGVELIATALIAIR